MTLTATENTLDGVLSGTGGPIHRFQYLEGGRTVHSFSFADADGDGVEEGGADLIPGNLLLGGFTLWRNRTAVAHDHTHVFRLNMNGGNITGTVASVLRTRAALHQATAGLAIVGANNITLGTLSTAVSGDPSTPGTEPVGGISVSQTGSFNVTTVSATTGIGNVHANGAGFRAIGNGTGSFSAGSIDVTSARVRGFGVNIEGYTSVVVSNLFDARSGACVGWRQPSNVVIRNIGSGGVSLPAVRASTASSLNSWMHASHVTVSALGDVTISGGVTTSVGVAGIDRRAGNITLTSTNGRVRVTGLFDARDPDFDAADMGDVLLTAGTTIEVGSVNLRLVDDFAFNAPGNSTILGEILGTNGLALSGDGGNPGTFVNGPGTDLRVPSGQIVIYDPAVNPALNGGRYRLADLAGVAGQGGWLQPPPRGTLITIR